MLISQPRLSGFVAWQALIRSECTVCLVRSGCYRLNALVVDSVAHGSTPKRLVGGGVDGEFGMVIMSWRGDSLSRVGMLDL